MTGVPHTREPKAPGAERSPSLADHDNLPDAARAARQWLWTSGALVVLGVSAIAMLWATYRIGDRHVVHFSPVERAAADLRVSVAESHLWMEEYLTGDERVDPETDVWGNLDEADRVCTSLLEGGPVEEGLIIVAPLEEPDLRRRVEEIQRLLSRFRTLARTRDSQRPSSGVGTDIDQRYDAIFHELLGEAAALEVEVESIMMRGRRRSQYLFGLILVAWASLLGVAIIALYRRERRRRVAEEALRNSEAQLRQAQKLEAVGRLAGGLAHDVNNYLATINAQCGLVKMLHGEVPGMTSKMDEVIATVGRTTSLIQRLLAFSRSQPVIDARVLDLNRLTGEMASLMRRLLADDVRLDLELAPDLWWVKVDPSQVEQVLVNLLVNAREAMPGGGRVRLCTANVVLEAGRSPVPEAQGEYVALSVSDQGCGIPAEVRDKIYEPFFSTKGREGHSGLGLSTVYGIVSQAGGHLRVESEVGQGTAFHVYLPRSVEAPEEARPPRDAARPAGAARRCRILLVEDNSELRRAAGAVLTAGGHEVDVAEDGDAGLERLAAAATPYDVVVTDLVMPGASGRRVAERALATDGTGVVLVSGFRDRVAVEDLVARSRVRYLDKPFAPELLLAAVEKMAAAETAEAAEAEAV